METGSLGLWEFLLQEGIETPKAVKVLDLFDPIFKVAEGERDLLLPAHPETEARMQKVLQAVLGKDRVHNVLLFSSREAQTLTDTVRGRKHTLPFKTSLGAVLEEKFKPDVQRCWSNSENARITAILWRVLGARLWGTLDKTLYTTYGIYPKGALGHMIWTSLWFTFLHYIRFLLAGKSGEAQAENFRSLVDMMAKGWIVFANDKEDAIAWNCLVSEHV